MTPMEIPRADVAKDMVAREPAEALTTAIVPDKRDCLTCAFGYLILSQGVHTGDRDEAVATIRGAQETTSFNVRTRAAIYRCGVASCKRAFIAFTSIGQPSIPDDGNIHVEVLPGTSRCRLPPNEWPQQI